MFNRAIAAIGALIGASGTQSTKGTNPNEIVRELFLDMMNRSSGDKSIHDLLGNDFLKEALQTGTNIPVAFSDPKSGIELHVSRSLVGVETRSAARDNPGNRKYNPDKPVEDGLMFRFQKYSTDGNRCNERFTPEEAEAIRSFAAKLHYVTASGHIKEVILEPRGNAVGSSQWGDDSGTITCQAKIHIDCKSGYPIEPTNGLHRNLQLEITEGDKLVATVNGN